MDRTRLSAYPHYSWYAHWLTVRPPRVFDAHDSRYVTHRLLLTTSGDADVAWASERNDHRFYSTVGDIGFFPCDFASHSLAITTTAGFQAYELCVPDSHIRSVCDSESLQPVVGLHAIPLFRDALIRASLLRLSVGSGGRQISEEIGDEIAARQIVMGISLLAGGRAPDWRKDTSVFDPCVMRRIVERLDAHLGVHFSLFEASEGFGLSPSHFARKFQHSTGLSLNRFMNRRRIGSSLILLRTKGASLSQLSLDLGFSSQSHFTRLFSGLTGFTPHQFRRLHIRMGE